MSSTQRHLPARPGRRLTGALVTVVLVLGATGCGGSDSSSPQPQAKPSVGVKTGTAKTGTAKTRRGVVLAPDTRPTTFSIGTLAGRLTKHDRTVFRHRVGKVVDSWIEGGFLRGDYPRTRFAQAYAGFTHTAAHDAQQQARLMTNARLGKKITGVVATTRQVQLDVLAPHGTIAATTARVLLRFETSGQVHKKLVVRGRLFLTRNSSGNWKIFGFDISKGRAR